MLALVALDRHQHIPVRPFPATIYTVAADGGGKRRVNLVGGYGLDWSSQGRLVFYRTRSGARIYTVRPSGKGLRRLTNDGRSFFPRWSPDGRWIVYVRYPPDRPDRFVRTPAVWVMRADGTQKREVVRNAFDPVWSPDGAYIAFTRGVRRIYRIRSDGSGLKQLYKARGLLLGGIGPLAWQPRPR